MSGRLHMVSGFPWPDVPLSYHSVEKPRGLYHGDKIRFGSSQRNTMADTFYRSIRIFRSYLTTLQVQLPCQHHEHPHDQPSELPPAMIGTALPADHAAPAAQRVGVQRAAGRYHADRSDVPFSASGCQNSPDPAAPLERRVGRALLLQYSV